MKKTTQSLLIAVLTLTSILVSTTAVRAQLNQDLMFGITSAQNQSSETTDLVVDLGDPASLYYGESWALGTLLASSGNTDPSKVQWGLCAGTFDGDHTLTVYTTSTSQPRDIQNINDITGYYIDLIYLGYGFNNTGSSLAPGNSFQMSSQQGDGTSWFQQTVPSSGQTASAIMNDYNNPNQVGFGKNDFYVNVNDASDPSSSTHVGIFSLDNAGNLVYSVPEPSTMALAAMGGASLMYFRRRK